MKEPPDELLFQVATHQNENDKPFIIDCEAEGEPAPKYFKCYSYIYINRLFVFKQFCF